MVLSMTGYANETGEVLSYGWNCEIRSVNAKGLDVRLRCPDWVEGLEIGLRALVAKRVKRGNVSVFFRLAATANGESQILGDERARELLTAIGRLDDMASELGVSLAQSSAADVLSLGLSQESAEPRPDDTKKLCGELLKRADKTLKEFMHSRRAEGAALSGVLVEQLTTIDGLIKKASEIVVKRAAETETQFRSNVTRLTEAVDLGPDRIAQELAILAVKSDVTEELDRLKSHVALARSLLKESGPIGRKFEFLCQEFNREANTLCSKAQFNELTQVGLDLKVVIDQMREQVQNVE